MNLSILRKCGYRPKHFIDSFAGKGGDWTARIVQNEGMHPEKHSQQIVWNTIAKGKGKTDPQQGEPRHFLAACLHLTCVARVSTHRRYPCRKLRPTPQCIARCRCRPCHWCRCRAAGSRPTSAALLVLLLRAPRSLVGRFGDLQGPWCRLHPYQVLLPLWSQWRVCLVHLFLCHLIPLLLFFLPSGIWGWVAVPRSARSRSSPPPLPVVGLPCWPEGG